MRGGEEEEEEEEKEGGRGRGRKVMRQVCVKKCHKPVSFPSLTLFQCHHVFQTRDEQRNVKKKKKKKKKKKFNVEKN